MLPAPVLAQPPELDVAEREIVSRTNEFRKSHNLEPLEVQPELAAAADAFAQLMARTGNYEHRADGRTPAERASQAGYERCIVAENIARVRRSGGFETQALAEHFVEGWKQSPGHRKNMLLPAVTQTGVAIAAAGNGRYYAVQMLGRPEDLSIRFEVVNRSGARATYRVDGKAFSLGPRVTRTHKRCTPAEIEVQGKKSRAKGGERFVID